MVAGEHRRIVIGERLGRLAGDDGARAAAIQHEAGGELRAVDARLAEQRQHLGRRPAVERRWLHRDQHQVGGEQRRAHQAGDARRPVDHHMIGVARQFRRFAMKRVARQADDTEQASAGLRARAAATSRAPSLAGRRRSE